MTKGYIYYAVRQQYMKALIDMYKAGAITTPPIIAINKIMSELQEVGKVKDKYYQLRKWQLQGQINNLFKLRIGDDNAKR